MYLVRCTLKLHFINDFIYCDKGSYIAQKVFKVKSFLRGHRKIFNIMLIKW